MSHAYWTESKVGDVAVVTSAPHPRRTLTIEGASQLARAITARSQEDPAPPLVLEIDVNHAELLEVRQMASGRPISDWAPWVEVVDSIANYPNVVVVSIPRQASCGGLELALAADIRFARPDAILGLFETRMGILPGCGGTQRLPRLVGSGHAAMLVLSGEEISGEEAARIGLVQHIFTDPTARAIDFAQRCSRNGSEVLIEAKKALRAARLPLNEGLRVEGRAFLKLVNQPTAERHMASWLSQQLEHE